MAVTRPFRFSSPVAAITSRRELVDHARKLEDLGYSTLTVSDHLAHHDNTLAPIPALMAVADATTNLRIAPLVLCNDFRHPVVVAKEAATLDLLSEGRLELGLGAGWMTTDYSHAGLQLDPAPVRIERLEEAVRVVAGLLEPGEFSFVGSHYRVDALDGTPSPVQRPRPPIVIGGGGRRVLGVAGRRADIVALNPSLPRGVIDASAGPSATPAATDRKLAWIREAAGDRFDRMEVQCRAQLAVITSDREGLIGLMADGFGLSPDDARATPHALAGTVEQVVEQLEAMRERWHISYIGIPASAADDFAPVVARLAGH